MVAILKEKEKMAIHFGEFWVKILHSAKYMISGFEILLLMKSKCGGEWNKVTRLAMIGNCFYE